MISLAIPTYNRSLFVLEAFSKVLNNPLIDDIVISDDHSDTESYCELWNLLANIHQPKVRLWRSEKNYGPLLNKYSVVRGCKNDWVILLDSDNSINDSFVNTVNKLPKEVDVLYSPETLYSAEGKVLWLYQQFNSVYIDRHNAKQYLKYGEFQAMLNTGNCFINRNMYLSVQATNEFETPELTINDALFFSYLWLRSGNRIKVVPGLGYTHRVHKGSWYKNNKSACIAATREIERKIMSW